MTRKINFNFAQAIETLGGSQELFQDIANTFLGQYEKDLAEIKDHIRTLDFKKLQEKAHCLKGTVAYLEPLETRASLLHLETQAQKAESQSLELNYKNAATLVCQLASELKEWLKNHPL